MIWFFLSVLVNIILLVWLRRTMLRMGRKNWAVGALQRDLTCGMISRAMFGTNTEGYISSLEYHLKRVGGFFDEYHRADDEHL